MTNMKFNLTFSLDNAESDEFDISLSLSRILAGIPVRVLEGSQGGKVYDINGNSIGEWSLSSD